MEFARGALLPARAVPVLDDFAARAAHLLQTPVALVSLVDGRGQNLPGAFGLPEPWNTERWTPLTHSFCKHVVASGQPLVIDNADDDPLVAENAAVMDLGVIAYLGAPLTLADRGAAVGALCGIDHLPRRWSTQQRDALTGLARECSAELGMLLRG